MKLIRIFLVFLFPFYSLQATQLKFATYNIRNYNYDPRSAETTDDNLLLELLRATSADIIAVQEIRNEAHFATFVRDNLNEYQLILSRCGGAGDQKLGFLYKSKKFDLMSFKEDLRIAGKDCKQGTRPLSIAKFYWKEEAITFHAVAVHLKSGGGREDFNTRQKQMRILASIINNELVPESPYLTVMGDFNTTDFILNNDNHLKFLEILESAQLSPLTAEIGCTSYWSNRGQLSPSILDHIVLNQAFLNLFHNFKTEHHGHCKIRSCSPSNYRDIGETYNSVSDHCPISTTLNS